jgi:hypothetical protein
MPAEKDKRNLDELLREARELRNARAKRTPEQIEKFGESLAASGQDLSNDAPRKSVKEVEDSGTMRGSAKPADFIAKYYKDKFPLEVAKAMLYNKNKGRSQPVLEEDAYSRLFDDIEFERDPNETRGASYAPRESKVGLPNEEAEGIEKFNNKTYREWSKSDDPKLRARAEKVARVNSYQSVDSMASDKTNAAEHEFGHHYARPAKGGVASTAEYLVSQGGRHKSGERFVDFHTASPSELTQAAGRFQREFFAETGKRITDPEEFLKLVNSDEKLEFMTPEAKRYLTFARRLQNESEAHDPNDDFFGTRRKEKKSREEAIRRMAEILPATVSVDESFEGRANARIAGKMS